MAVTTPRVAAANSFKSQQTSFDHTVFNDCFFHVLATSGSKSTTSWKQGRDEVLIDQYRKYGNLS